MKLMIATPAYSGKVDIPYALSLANTCTLLQAHRIEVQPLLTASGSLLVAERNRLIEAFWQSDCTHVLCLDADLGWPPQAILAMLESGKEFIAGVYPARGQVNAFTFRPSLNPDQTLIREKHLLKMEYIPAGFMLIARSAIDKMRRAHTDLFYKPKDARSKTEEAYCFFNTEVWDGEFWGEDYVFCRKARAAGVEIWVDPLIQFDHAGTLGMLTDVLTNQPQEVVHESV
jgi:hypothetical protein